MKKYDPVDEKIQTILQENGLEQPTELFSHHLVHSVVQQQRKREAAAFKAGRWVGKLILGILVSFNLLFLYYLNPFPGQSVFFTSVAAFIAGVWGAIAVMRRFQVSDFSGRRLQ